MSHGHGLCQGPPQSKDRRAHSVSAHNEDPVLGRAKEGQLIHSLAACYGCACKSLAAEHELCDCCTHHDTICLPPVFRVLCMAVMMAVTVEGLT